jgi:hypothetical protein
VTSWVEVAAHLNDHVLPPLPIRQWVLSVPKRIRPFFHHHPRPRRRRRPLPLGPAPRPHLRGLPPGSTSVRSGSRAFDDGAEWAVSSISDPSARQGPLLARSHRKTAMPLR